MDDRNVQYPNRFQLTKVDGTDDIYEIIPAPGKVYTEGTFINKFALLKDTTAALFGLDVSNVPDDVLAFLGKYNQYWWKRRVNIQNAGYVEKRTLRAEEASLWYDQDITYTRGGKVTIEYYSNISINQDTGAVSYINPGTLSTTYGKNGSGGLSEAQLKSRLLHKYVNAYTSWHDKGQRDIVYINDDAEISVGIFTPDEDSYLSSSVENGYTISSEYKDSSTIGEWEYLWSADRNAYPDSGIIDNYEYQFLGIPFDNAVSVPKIETGSYVGTGTYGASNPCSLTFSFVPKVWAVSCATFYNAKDYFQTAAEPMPIVWGVTGNPSNNYLKHYTYSGKTVSWYSTQNVAYQDNALNYTYYYYAIG